MKFIDNRTTKTNKACAGDILDIEGYGKRLIIFNNEVDQYNVIDLNNGKIQLDWMDSIEEIYEFYNLDLDEGRQYSLIKNSDIVMEFKGCL